MTKKKGIIFVSAIEAILMMALFVAFAVFTLDLKTVVAAFIAIGICSGCAYAYIIKHYQ